MYFLVSNQYNKCIEVTIKQYLPFAKLTQHEQKTPKNRKKNAI